MTCVFRVALLLGTAWFLTGDIAAIRRAAAAERTISLDADWRFRIQDAKAGSGEETPAFDDSGWSTTRVPHMPHELANESPRSRKVVWFRRDVRPPASDPAGRAVLEVTDAADLKVWLNGKPVKTLAHQSTLLADVTESVRAGENVLVLQTGISGVQGPVRLHVVPAVHLGVRRPAVDFPDWAGGPAPVRIRTEAANHAASEKTLELRASIMGPDGSTIGTARSEPVTLIPGESDLITLHTPAVNDPPLWSPETPQLCRVVVELWDGERVVDRQESAFGFRWLRFEPDGPFTLNGQAYPVRGVVYVRPQIHRFADRASLWEYEVGLLKGMGVNFVRSARDVDQSFYDVCDREGLFVTAPMHFYNPNSESESEISLPSAESDLENTVRELYNHPSLVAWHTNGEGKNAPVARAMSRVTEMIRASDPSRPVMCCELGWRSPGTVGLVDCDIAGQGNYTGWYEGTLEHIGPYIDDYRALLKERYGRPLPLVISNFGAAGDAELHTSAPRRNDFSHEYHTAYQQRYFAEMEQRPWLAGGFIFCFRDLNSEQPIPRHTWKGMLDLQDRKKDGYFFYQSRWTTEPMVHITQNRWTSRDLWPAGGTRPVEVFSNCEQVELIHNGRSLGMRSEENNRFVWEVAFTEGENSLRAIASKADARVEASSDFKVNFVPPAVEPRLVSSSTAGRNPKPQIVWDAIPGVDAYAVYAGSEPDFDVQHGRLVGTVTQPKVSLDGHDGARYFKVLAKAGEVSGPASFSVGRQPGSIQWKFTNSGWLLSSPAVADLTGDRQLEIVIGSYNGSVYALQNDGTPLWSFDAGDPVQASPVVAALAPGEPPSVVVNSAKALYVLTRDGSLKWRHEGIRHFDRSVRSPSVVDLDGDGKLEIIVGSDTGQMLAFAADGTPRWEFSTAGPGNRGLNPTTCVAVDLPDGGGKALCFATDDGFLYLLDANGKQLWKHDLGIGDLAVGLPPNPLTPAASALHDPAPVTIISGGGALRALDTAGNVMWERSDRRGFPQVSNLFRDGDRQIVLVSGRQLHVLDHRGRDVWSYTLPHPRDYWQQPPVSADLDADGEADLIAGTRATNLMAISSRGQLMWSFTSDDEITGSPAVGDINRDGIVDVVFGSRDGSLYVLSAGPSPAYAQVSL
ncbi:MAG: PQQ-binding-like beta-propeller repeat protein, partial [Planctomycetaceae bacterium]